MMNSIPSFVSRLAIALVMAGSASGAIAQSDRLSRVMASKELRVCIWPDYYGITYRSPRTHKLSGIDVDLSADLARELGVTLRYVDSSFALLVDNLLGDKCDIAMHAVGVTPQRTARLAFSQPYLRSDIYAIASRDSKAVRNWADLDQPGRVLAVQAGTVMEPVMKEALKKAKVLVVSPPATREQEVISGRADAFMTDYPYSRRMADLTDWAVVIAPPTAFHLTDYAYALAPGDGSLLRRVDQYIDAIKKDGRLRRFAAVHKLDPIVVSP